MTNIKKRIPALQKANPGGPRCTNDDVADVAGFPTSYTFSSPGVWLTLSVLSLLSPRALTARQSSGRFRACLHSQRALGVAPNRRLDDDVRRQPPIRLSPRCDDQNLQWSASLLFMQSHRQRQKLGTEKPAYQSGPKTGFSSGPRKFCSHRPVATATFPAQRFVQ